MLKRIMLSVLITVSPNIVCSDLFTIAFKEKGIDAVKLQNITLFMTKDSAKIQEEVFEQLKKLGFSEAASHGLRGFMLYFPSRRPVLQAGVKSSNMVITDADVKLLQHEQVKEELEQVKKILSDRTIEFSKVNFSQPLTFPAEGIETFHVQGFDGQKTFTSAKYAVKPGYRYEISKATEVNGKYFCAGGEEITPFNLCVHRTPLKKSE